MCSIVSSIIQMQIFEKFANNGLSMNCVKGGNQAVAVYSYDLPSSCLTES